MMKKLMIPVMGRGREQHQGEKEPAKWKEKKKGGAIQTHPTKTASKSAARKRTRLGEPGLTVNLPVRTAEADSCSTPLAHGHYQ